MAPRKLPLALALVFAACGRSTELPPPDSPEAGVSTPDALPDLTPADLRADTHPSLSIDPRLHDFGTVAVGAMSDPFTFRISNLGAAEARDLTIQLTGADFLVAPADTTCAATFNLPAASSCTFAVQFKPGSRGVKNGAVVFKGAGHTEMLSLTGGGAGEGLLIIHPTQLHLSGTVGVPSPALRVTVANAGDLFTGPITVMLSGADAAHFAIQNNLCLAPLAAATSCTLEVVLKATTAGMKVATLTASSPTGTKAVRNIGATATAPLTVATNTGEFQIAANTCTGMALMPGGTCAFALVFRPSSVGQKSATATVTGDPNQTGFAALAGSGI
jgi:hypothetical protein